MARAIGQHSSEARLVARRDDRLSCGIPCEGRPARMMARQVDHTRRARSYAQSQQTPLYPGSSNAHMGSLKFAIRTLFRTPFVTAITIVSLALGIGATAGIFSVFHQVLLQSLAVPSPPELVNLGAPGPKPGFGS